MVYSQSAMAIVIFVAFVLFVLCISFYFARKTSSASGYFAAGGTIHWSVNGIAFAGDYLSAASFLGICGMIATKGYDGFLYSIGYLAGWIVALFVVAEPMKRLGKYTFSDALDVRFNSKGIRAMAAISTLVVSMFYLIPQMVGAGVLVKPLLGLPHSVGVVMVGAIVIFIVATAGMTSTTYVQFLKGALLIIFSTILVISLFYRGLHINSDYNTEKPYHKFKFIQAMITKEGKIALSNKEYKTKEDWQSSPYVKKGFIELVNVKDNQESIWSVRQGKGGVLVLEETLWVTTLNDGTKLYNGALPKEGRFYPVGHIGLIKGEKGDYVKKTGALGPVSYLERLKDSIVILWGKKIIKDGDSKVAVYYQKPTRGNRLLRPGLKFKVDNATPMEKLNFISLMLALFCGTAALPHILIRYYTVKSPQCARKSTIVAIAAIGFFYILTLYMGLGAMVNGVLNITDNNMAGPLLAKSFGIALFSIISAIAFATVLGTVSGLIVAATGAVAHDIFDVLFRIKMTDKQKVMVGKITAVVVGCLAMYLGIIFEGMNVSFLVGWAFAVAASANLPSIIMVLFWKKTTQEGVTGSIIVGIVSSLGLILISPDMYVRYGLLPAQAPITLNNPGIISIPLAFITLVVISLLTQKKKEAVKA
ncbi:MAG: cation acetate symporter [bacterium]|nr:cation acetate symporter [bacterium]